MRMIRHGNGLPEHSGQPMQGMKKSHIGRRLLRKIMRRETCQMLFEAFEANEDVTSAYQFWKSRFSRGEIEYWAWDFLRKLTGKTSGASFSTREIINICKAVLRRDPSNYWAADELVETSKSLTDMEARITLLRSALDTLNLSSNVTRNDEVEMARNYLVEGLAEAVMEKGEEKYAVGFWTTLVRKCPSSWSISEALHSAFVANGDDQAAMQFWGRMRRVEPATTFCLLLRGELSKCRKIRGSNEDLVAVVGLFPERGRVSGRRSLFSPNYSQVFERRYLFRIRAA